MAVGTPRISLLQLFHSERVASYFSHGDADENVFVKFSHIEYLLKANKWQKKHDKFK